MWQLLALKESAACTTEINVKVWGQGVLRGPTFKIEFLEFLDTREQELPAGFYLIRKYCS